MSKALISLMLVFIGGMLGTLARYSLDKVYTFDDIFLYNLLGCLLMGVVVEYTRLKRINNYAFKSLVQTGFLGAFTSYSAILLFFYLEFKTSSQILLYLSVNITISIVTFVIGVLISRIYCKYR